MASIAVEGGCGPAHKALSEDYLCVEAKLEATASAPATGGPTAAPASEARGVDVGAIVVGRQSVWGRAGRLG